MKEEKKSPEAKAVPECVTVAEAARIIGMSARSVYRYIHAKRLPGYRLGGMILVMTADAHAFQRPGR